MNLHGGSIALTSFAASLVEFVEALTIVLAVGATRGWKSAFTGTLAAIGALVIVVAIAGPSIQLVPVHAMQLVVGTVVAVFGFKWLRKATLRSAGRIPMHDEEKEFSATVSALSGASSARPLSGKLDRLATLTAFKGVFLEGIEVAFIVAAAGSASGRFDQAILGATSALILVVLVGIAVHRPLSRVPENSLKKFVGVLLSAFGIFWVGEGLGFEWPGGDVFLLTLAAAFAAVSWSATAMLKRKST